MRRGGKAVYLGSYATPEEAALRYARATAAEEGGWVALAPRTRMRMENRNHAETDTGNVEIESLERTAPRESVRSQLDTEDDTDLRVVKGGSWIPFRMVSRSAQGGVLATIASNRLVSGAVFTAGVALIVTFAVSLSRSASRPLPRPPDSMMCSGGGNGELPRISRAAFQHWTSMSAPPSENLVIMLGDGYGPQCHALARSVRSAAALSAGDTPTSMR